MGKILFICTGNYYRSRFSEALINYHCACRGIAWSAFSRGLAIWMAEGPISPFTEAALKERNIDLSYTGTDRTTLQERDLKSADRIIALDRAEHYRMMQEQFPAWADKIEYWNHRDVQWDSPEAVLPKLEETLFELLKELSEQCGTHL